ncbi:MAG: hypothetical protein QXT53_07640 [Ignisphaera sp.]
MLDVVGGFFSIAYEDLYNVLVIYNFSIAVFGHVYVILPHYLCYTMSGVY